jgi:hypothetical protein
MKLCRTIVKRGKVPYAQKAGDNEDQVFLSVFDTRTRRVEKKVFVGLGTGGQVASSPVALVVVSQSVSIDSRAD